MKKITRKEKEKLAKKGICWKCGEKTIKCNNGVISCENCKLRIVKY